MRDLLWLDIGLCGFAVGNMFYDLDQCSHIAICTLGNNHVELGIRITPENHLNLGTRITPECHKIVLIHRLCTRYARFMGPTWDPPGSCRPQMGPMLAPWILLSGILQMWIENSRLFIVIHLPPGIYIQNNIVTSWKLFRSCNHSKKKKHYDIMTQESVSWCHDTAKTLSQQHWTRQGSIGRVWPLSGPG